MLDGLNVSRIKKGPFHHTDAPPMTLCLPHPFSSFLNRPVLSCDLHSETIGTRGKFASSATGMLVGCSGKETQSPLHLLSTRSTFTMPLVISTTIVTVMTITTTTMRNTTMEITIMTTTHTRAKNRHTRVKETKDLLGARCTVERWEVGRWGVVK